MHFRHLCAVIGIGLSLSTTAFATTFPIPNLDNLVEASTLIVVGELTSVERESRADAIDFNGRRINVRVHRGTFRFDQILKGNATLPSFTFEFKVPDEWLGWSIATAHAYGLFFFNEKSGTLGFTDVYHAWIAIPRGISVTADTPLERVAGTLGEVLLVPDSSRNMKTTALFYLEFGKSDASLQALRNALTKVDPAVGLNAARALLGRGDASGLEVIKQAFLPGPQSLPNMLEQTVPGVLSSLSDPKLIPDLEELLHSSSRYMRRGVVMALMGTGSPDALNALRRALGDSDVEVRYYAVVGLARITNDPMVTSMDQFKADETKYLSYWSKDRWREKGEPQLPAPRRNQE